MHTPAEYRAVLSTRCAARTPCFDLLLLSRNRDVSVLRLPRLGMVVPKRLARCAVLRNLIKRQAREVFRHRKESLPVADIVVRLSRWPSEVAVLKEVPAKLRQRMRQELETLLEKSMQRQSTHDNRYSAQ